MAYLIDTDILINSIKGNSVVNQRISHVASIPKAISIITYGELLYGAKKSTQREKNTSIVYRLAEIFHYDDCQAAGRSSFTLFSTRSYFLSFFSYNPWSIHRYCSPLSSILLIIPQSLRITAMRARPVPRFSLSSW